MDSKGRKSPDGCHGKKYNKSFGKNLKSEDVHTVPEIFFGTREPDDKIAVCVKIMAKQIRAIYEAFDSQRKYIIYGSSLLMSYDADAVNRFKLGDIDENALLNSLINGVTSHQGLTDRLCEAYFYLGKYHGARGNRGVASNYFKLALSTNVYEYVEHRYARLELERLRSVGRASSDTIEP